MSEKLSRKEKQEIRFAEMSKIEKGLRKEGLQIIVGVDEVGRGPLAGPVVTAAVALPSDFYVPEINDSKKLSEKKREELAPLIKEQAIAYSIGQVNNEVIDEINILEATKIAMKGCIMDLQRKLQKMGKDIDILLIDAVRLENIDIRQMNIIKGDAKSVSIAAASILAKVTRDRMMIEYAKEYPGYAFESNKGYGTKAHYEGLNAQGLTPIHRKSFLSKYL